MLGLKRGQVELCDHEVLWEVIAYRTIKELESIFEDTALDIQHVGSTAIKTIKAKPIIDIAVGVRSLEELPDCLTRLEKTGIYKDAAQQLPDDILYVAGDFVNEVRTHHIHIVKFESTQWFDYINFRDYLNANLNVAKTYEDLKMALLIRLKGDRTAYTIGKEDFINNTLRKAQLWSLLGKRG